MAFIDLIGAKLFRTPKMMQEQVPSHKMPLKPDFPWSTEHRNILNRELKHLLKIFRKTVGLTIEVPKLQFR